MRSWFFTLFLPILVYADGTIAYADLKTSHPLLGKRRHRAAHVSCPFSLGSRCDQGVSFFASLLIIMSW